VDARNAIPRMQSYQPVYASQCMLQHQPTWVSAATNTSVAAMPILLEAVASAPMDGSQCQYSSVTMLHHSSDLEAIAQTTNPPEPSSRTM
jgi:hypothetical protein